MGLQHPDSPVQIRVAPPEILDENRGFFVFLNPFVVRVYGTLTVLFTDKIYPKNSNIYENSLLISIISISEALNIPGSLSDLSAESVVQSRILQAVAFLRSA